MRQYLDQLKYIMHHGEIRQDRTGTGTKGAFGLQSRYDLREGFPLVTTKKVLFDAVKRELIWMLAGSSNIAGLTEFTLIWDAWADENGDLGPIYGKQWRAWEGLDPVTDKITYHDQIKEAIRKLTEDPFSRRNIVNAWAVHDIDKMKLPPCHMMFQLYVSACNKYVDLMMYQRSADMVLGVPFNIASYALLLTLFARECGRAPRFFVHTIGDAHIYLNHIEKLNNKQLMREPRALPQLFFTCPSNKGMLELQAEDIDLAGYDPHGFLQFDVSV